MIQDSVNVLQDSLTRVDTILIESQSIPVPDQMLTRLTTLSDHLGVTAEMLYDSYYIQYFLIKGIYGIVLGLVFVSLTMTLSYMFLVKYKATIIGHSMEAIDGDDLLVVVVLGIGTIICTVLALVYGLTSIPHALNPAYYAIIELIRTLR